MPLAGALSGPIREDIAERRTLRPGSRASRRAEERSRAGGENETRRNERKVASPAVGRPIGGEKRFEPARAEREEADRGLSHYACSAETTGLDAGSSAPPRERARSIRGIGTEPRRTGRGSRRAPVSALGSDLRVSHRSSLFSALGV